MDISLEKVDAVKERTGATYKEAKEALEKCNGDVLDAIIYIEDQKRETFEPTTENKNSETIEEFKIWLKDLVAKGNISRIKVSKDDKKIVDVPVNAGIAAGVIAIIIPPILAFVVVAAVVTQVTIEITKTDGSVEVINKYISNAVSVAKEKASDISEVVKDKASDISEVVKDRASDISEKVKDKVSDSGIDNIKKYSSKEDDGFVEENTFTYTVNFDEEEK